MKAAIYLLLSIIILLVVKFNCPIVQMEGYLDLLSSNIFPGYATYASEYSDRRFLKVKMGMSEKEVISILGEPLNAASASLVIGGYVILLHASAITTLGRSLFIREAW